MEAEGDVFKKPGGNARREYEFLEPACSLELYQSQAVRRDVSIYMEGGIIGRGIVNLSLGTLDLIQSRIGDTIDVIKARAVMSTSAG